MTGRWAVNGIGCLRKLRTILAPTAHRRAENPPHRDAQERVRSVGTVVHVLLQLAALTGRSPPANESDGIDLDQQSSGAEVNGRIGIEHISLPKRELFRLETRRILVQQIAEVGGRLMSRGNREEHHVSLVDRPWTTSTMAIRLTVAICIA